MPMAMLPDTERLGDTLVGHRHGLDNKKEGKSVRERGQCPPSANPCSALHCVTPFGVNTAPRLGKEHC